MKNRPKQIILFSILFFLIAISLYAYFGTSSKANTPKTEAVMFEELPNGQSKVVDSSTIKKETLEWLNNKKSELVLLIAEQTKLESDDVLVVLGPMSDLKDTDSYVIACSVVLKTESTFEEKIINNILEGIISTISQDSVDVKISEENISIVNSTGVKLH